MATHDYFMRQALAEAEKALRAGDFPVGCLMVCDQEIVARGYRTSTRNSETNELDHAEISAVRWLIEQRPDIDPSRVTVYSTMEPCLMCYATMLLNGLRTFVYAYEDIMGGGANLPLSQLNPLYKEMQVTIVPHVLRDESLRLFKKYFKNPENTYLQDSLLASYTLAQKTS